MSIQELEQAVVRLNPAELSEFGQWFEEFQQDLWDKQIADDSRNGRLDALIQQANRDFESGLCKKI